MQVASFFVVEDDLQGSRSLIPTPEINPDLLIRALNSDSYCSSLKMQRKSGKSFTGIWSFCSSVLEPFQFDL